MLFSLQGSCPSCWLSSCHIVLKAFTYFLLMQEHQLFKLLGVLEKILFSRIRSHYLRYHVIWRQHPRPRLHKIQSSTSLIPLSVMNHYRWLPYPPGRSASWTGPAQLIWSCCSVHYISLHHISPHVGSIQLVLQSTEVKMSTLMGAIQAKVC